MYNVSSPTVSDTNLCHNTPDQIAGLMINDGGGNNIGGACPPPTPPTPPCPGDVNGDGEVGINDFLDLLASWGRCP
jgi:hypothetical protein